MPVPQARGFAQAGEGTALLIEEGAPAGRDLVIGSSGLSQAGLITLVSAGLSSAA